MEAVTRKNHKVSEGVAAHPRESVLGQRNLWQFMQQPQAGLEFRIKPPACMENATVVMLRSGSFRRPSRMNQSDKVPSHAMQTQVEFRSSKFPPYEGEEEQINPGLWGKRLAEYLVQKLAEKGIETGEMVAEDWGWYVPLRNEGFPLALCCGHQDGDDDEFLCFTEPATPVVKKFFKKIDATAQLTQLTEALRQILAADPDIREIVWSEPGH